MRKVTTNIFKVILKVQTIKPNMYGRLIPRGAEKGIFFFLPNPKLLLLIVILIIPSP